jgi:hypothetical protein
MSHVLMSVIDVHVYHHYQQYSIYIMTTTDFLFVFLFLLAHIYIHYSKWCRGRHGRDHMVVGFTTTYAISAYHHWCCEFDQGEVYNIMW